MNHLLARARLPHPLPAWLADMPLPRSALLFESDDLEQARREISKLYRPHRFTAARRRATPATLYNLSGDHTTVSWFAYGTDITITPEIVGDFALVLTTLAGRADIRSGGRAHAGGPGDTVLIASDEPARFRYSEDNVQMGVRIDAQRIDALWRRMTGREPPAALHACAVLEARQRERWLASVRMLTQVLHPDTAPALRAMQLPLAEEMLILSLIGDRLADAMPADTLAPACVKRAIAFIEEHADRPLTLADIASAARCSTRTLQRAFQQARRQNAMRCLKEVRLRRVRDALRDPDETASITTLAMRWGFAHLGQFAADYRRRYGERPSETRMKR